ncbi:hypothetical protein [Listeria monocytogenes]|uniref:hypothetical protein n=1 Tax=Listeria monocytogenes TaxID=1639 RepID=UPI000874F239|nr:hypothetical protein [Listeria monocytogenes]EAC8350572.1 hypothetical protein [Listeria monocytogenes]EAD0739962.1 hypothetical protein [Listeria monocytogenes]EAD9140323.1 hypothetical protein [Listeria monocytogenes]EIL9239390.1 hypothetical protein [Listeria monocytogenes]EJC6459513.1 hypothetical protein [Listeria monocytogenes]
MKLNKNDIRLIVKTVKEVNRDELNDKKRERKNWKLRNVRLLMTNYRLLKRYCNDVTDQIDVIESILEEVGRESLILHSINDNKLKTQAMMKHVDNVLHVYKDNCVNGNLEDKRRYKLLYEFHVKEPPLPTKIICEKYNISRASLYRELKRSYETIVILMFGIDSFDDLADYKG